MGLVQRLGSLGSDAKTFWDEMAHARVFGRAAEMAFWLFLSIVPLGIMAGLVLARVALQNFDVVSQSLSAMPPEMRELLTGELRRVASWHGGAVGGPAAAVFLWLASNGVHAIFDTFEAPRPDDRRPWWLKRAIALATCAALPVSVALIAVLMSGLEWMTGAFPMQVVIRWVAGPLFALALVSGLFVVGTPPKNGKRMPILPGAAVAVMLQMLLGFAYKTYLLEVGTAGAYQAGLTAIAVTMTALYLFATALLVGIQVNEHLGKSEGHSSVSAG